MSELASVESRPLTEKEVHHADEQQTISSRPAKLSCRHKLINVYRQILRTYVAIVPILITVSFVMSAYSTFNCNFMVIQIGFEPLNEGIYSENLFLSPVVFEHEGKCYRHSSTFTDVYIDGDLYWTVSRIGSLTSFGAGFFAFILVWMMFLEIVVSNQCYIIILQPTVLVLVFSELLKLLLIRSRMCTSKMWRRQAYKAVSVEVAKNCTLFMGAKISFASIWINIFCMIIFWRVRAYRGKIPLITLNRLSPGSSLAPSSSGSRAKERIRRKKNRSNREECDKETQNSNLQRSTIEENMEY